MTDSGNEQHIVIEGCYLSPECMKDFVANYSEKIIPVFFGFSENYNRENFETAIMKYRNVIERLSGQKKERKMT